MMRRFMGLIFDHLATKIISIFVAVVLWIVVLSSRNVEVTKEVPLELITSPEMTTATEIPDHVLFQLIGPKAFRRALIDRPEPPIRINLSGEKHGTVTYNFSPDDIRLPLGVKVQLISPPSIRLKLEPVRYVTVNARADVRGVPEAGYRVVKTEVRPSQVKIKGSKQRVSAVSELTSLPVDISGASRSTEFPLNFDLNHLGVQLDGPSPVLYLELEPVSPNFRLKNVGIRVLAAHSFRLSDNSVTVFVRATPEDLKSLDHAQVYAEVDLRGQKKGKYTAPLKVSAPHSVSVIKVVPDKVEVTLY